jgi:hypothetical protein
MLTWIRSSCFWRSAWAKEPWTPKPALLMRMSISISGAIFSRDVRDGEIGGDDAHVRRAGRAQFNGEAIELRLVAGDEQEAMAVGGQEAGQFQADADGCARHQRGLNVCASRDGDAFVEIDVLHGVEELDAFGHRLLEGFAAADEAGAAGALVDDGGADGFGEVAGAFALAAAVDQGERPM